MHTLDATYTSTGILLSAAILAICLLAIQVIIIRWVFRIDEQVKNQKAIIWIMMKQWQKGGATAEEIENFKKQFSIK